MQAHVPQASMQHGDKHVLMVYITATWTGYQRTSTLATALPDQIAPSEWHQTKTSTQQWLCFGTRKTIGVKEVHLITNALAVRRR